MENSEVEIVEHQADIYQDAVVFITGNIGMFSKKPY